MYLEDVGDAQVDDVSGGTEDVGLDETGYEGTDDGDYESGDEGGYEGKVYRTQDEVDVAIERRLARERRNLAKRMGFDSIEEAAEFANAGMAVASASGLSPAEVRQRLAQQAAAHTQQGGNVPPQYGAVVSNDIQRELRELRNLVEDDRAEKARKQQITAARKEFGKLFDEYMDDIEDKADESGLSIMDAAAVVLRPKLREHIESTATKKKQVQRRRKVEGGDGKPAEKVNYESALTAQEKRVAQKMGISFERYYQRKKELGEIE